MKPNRILQWMDIEAPPEEVFEILANCERRLQLSPSYGKTKINSISDDFPQEGSKYQVQSVEDDEPGYEVLVTAYHPPHKFAYRLTDLSNSHVTWTLGEITSGVRLSYEVEFELDEPDDEETLEAERKFANEWLINIRRYAELRGSVGKRSLRWLVDRTLLKWTVAQRRVILLLLAFETVMFLTAIAAIIGFGLMRLLSR